MVRVGVHGCARPFRKSCIVIFCGASCGERAMRSCMGSAQPCVMNADRAFAPGHCNLRTYNKKITSCILLGYYYCSYIVDGFRTLIMLDSCYDELLKA